MSRVLPYPLLAASLLVMWLLLNGFSAGHFVLGGILALVAARAMLALQPAKPRLRRWSLIPRLFLVVLADVARSNLAVTRIVLTGGHAARRAGFVTIALELRDPTALAVLACIITSTPGTAWIDYNGRSGQLVIHVLDLIDEEEMAADIKRRYESLLLEIFE